jgi:hypothetical protein
MDPFFVKSVDSSTHTKLIQILPVFVKKKIRSLNKSLVGCSWDAKRTLRGYRKGHKELAPRVIPSGSEPDVKLSPAEEVMGSNLLCPLGVRSIICRVGHFSWGSTQGFPVLNSQEKKKGTQRGCYKDINWDTTRILQGCKK